MKIAFVGKAGAGKTTAARFLEEKLNYIRLSFATELKEEIVDEGLATWEEIEAKTPKIRSLFQTYGMEKRAEDPTHWIKDVEWKLHEFQNLGYENFVIDDLRFLLEAEWAKKNGFILIRLLRLEEYEHPGITEENANHVSETEQDDIITQVHFQVHDLENLYEKLTTFLIVNGELE